MKGENAAASKQKRDNKTQRLKESCRRYRVDLIIFAKNIQCQLPVT